MMEYRDVVNPTIMKFCHCIDKNDYTSLTPEEKEDIQIFLLFTITVFNDGITVANINTISDFYTKRFGNRIYNEESTSSKTVDFFKIPLNVHGYNLNKPSRQLGSDNRRVFRIIRNSFPHYTGGTKIDSHNVLTINSQSRSSSNIDTSIETSKDVLIRLLESSLGIEALKNSSNDIISTLCATYEAVKTNNFSSMKRNAKLFIELSLVLSYNKESLIDKYLDQQQSLLDCSKFKVSLFGDTDTKNLRDGFFNKYKMNYSEDTDEEVLNQCYPNLINNSDNNNQDKPPYLCNINKMAKTNTKYPYPTPILLTHLRNAVSHGRIRCTNHRVYFWDQKSSKEAPYIEISIKINDLKKFLNSEVFKESLSTPVEELSGNANKLFLFEKVFIAKRFKDYVDVYQYYLNKSQIDTILYLLENNKIAQYILEYPTQRRIDEVLNYQLQNGLTLQTYLEQTYNVKLSDYEEYSFSSRIEWKKKNLKTLSLYLKSYFTNGGDLSFWEAYYCYLHNIDSGINLLFLDTSPFFQKQKINKQAADLFAKNRKKFLYNINNIEMLMQVTTILYHNDNPTDTLFNVIQSLKNRKLLLQRVKFTSENFTENSSYYRFNEDYFTKEIDKNDKAIDRINQLVNRGNTIVNNYQSLIADTSKVLGFLGAAGLLYMEQSYLISPDIYTSSMQLKNLFEILHREIVNAGYLSLGSIFGSALFFSCLTQIIKQLDKIFSIQIEKINENIEKLNDEKDELSTTISH